MSETLLSGLAPADSDTGPEVTPLGEGRMVREDGWREVHRLFHVERRSKSAIARELALDRKTVRGILQAAAWQAYTRPERADTLLAEHASYLQTRAPQVQYSARILFQELRRARGYRGSYETVKRFVRPLRTVEQAVEPPTVCHPAGEGRVVWNATFKQFADYWGFEPHLCRAYRAQTKGKVESGVKYFKRNFLPGRTFIDEQDLREQLGQWQAEIADVRIHGTTHERPADRFIHERSHLIATGGQPGFRLEASQPRRVAEDYLVSFETNRYSVPFTLIGQTVEVTRRGGRLHITHRGGLVAEHEELAGKHQLRIRPEHGPGAIARTARRVAASLPSERGRPALPEVEIRDLAIYEALGAAAVTP